MIGGVIKWHHYSKIAEVKYGQPKNNKWPSAVWPMTRFDQWCGEFQKE
jgi:hypothetical protein